MGGDAVAEPLERTWWWAASCFLNLMMLGNPGEPMCSRAWRRGWIRFGYVMQLLFRDPVHCEAVHLRWRVVSEAVERGTFVAGGLSR